jgi:hypothetical protein
MKAGAQMNDYESVQPQAEPRTRSEHATISRRTGRTPGTFVLQGSEIVLQDGTTKLRAQKVLFSAYSGWVVNLLEVRAGHARMIDPVLLHRRSD